MLRGPPRTLDIAVYLLDKDEVEVGKVMSDLDLANETFYSGVDRLRLLGFLHKRREKGFPPHSYVGLTSKGTEAAKLLRPLADIVGGTILGLRGELEELEGKERGEDENRRMVEILCDLQDINFTLGEWDEAEVHANRALDIASALGESKSLSKSLRTLGRIQHRRGEYEESESMFSESLQISTRINDLDAVAESRRLLGAIHEDRGEYDKAMEEYGSAVEASKVAHNVVLEARSKLALGRMLARKGKYKESLKKMKESAAAFEKLGEDDELPRAYANLGATAFYINLDESVKWHQKSIDMAIRISDLRILGHSLCNIAGCMNQKGEPKKALDYLERALQISKELDEKKLICSANIQSGWSYRLEGTLNESRKCFESAVRVAEGYDLPYHLGDALLNWAELDIDRDDRNEAKKKLKRALEIFDRLGNQARVNKIRNILGSLRSP
ncbi:MAG: tetratricopeptide repeat protein [Thermoplasmata archaeon]|nr:tetratricopeptide repeat protein [Thermoplasmata archaeon]